VKIATTKVSGVMVIKPDLRPILKSKNRGVREIPVDGRVFGGKKGHRGRCRFTSQEASDQRTFQKIHVLLGDHHLRVKG